MTIFKFVLLFFVTSFAQQKKIDLEDVNIKGESLKNLNFDLTKKDRTDIEKHLRIKENFRDEILRPLPEELRTEQK
jgi:hypothetical protein